MNNVLLVRVVLAFRIFTPYSIYSGVPSLYDFNSPQVVFRHSGNSCTITGCFLSLDISRLGRSSRQIRFEVCSF